MRDNTPNGSEPRRFHVSALLALACALMVAGLGFTQFYLVPDFSLILFYFVPVAIAGWYLGSGVAIALAIASAAIATVARTPQSPFTTVQAWNAAMRLGILLLCGQLAFQLRQRREPAAMMRSLRTIVIISIVCGFAMVGISVALLRTPAGAAGVAGGEMAKAESVPEGSIAELARDLRVCLQVSRPLLLGSRDPRGQSCVTIMTTGSVAETIPSHIADLNGGPGTTMGALYFFDRREMTSAHEDFEWHQTRLRTYLENVAATNSRAAPAAEMAAREAMILSELLDNSEKIPATLQPVGLTQSPDWPTQCLVALDRAIQADDLILARRWAAELAAATAEIEDLHRWLGFLVHNHLTALDFQARCESLFNSPESRKTPYEINGQISQYPAGMLSLNGQENYYELERQAECLFGGPADWASFVNRESDADRESIWVMPAVRMCYLKVRDALSESNQKVFDQAARTPYEHSFLNSMLFRADRSSATEQLCDAMSKFSATHPSANVTELMGAIMYRGHSFAGFEWADRYQPTLVQAAEKLTGTDEEAFLEAAKWTGQFNEARDAYGMTFSLRNALAIKKLDCVRATDMIGAIFRDAGRTRFGFVVWSAASKAHSVAAYLGSENGKPKTLIADGLTHVEGVEQWPDAYFQGHRWPPGLEDSAPPYCAELYVRGLDSYVWAEGYIIRGDNAGWLGTSAIPYLPLRTQTGFAKIYDGAHPE